MTATNTILIVLSAANGGLDAAATALAAEAAAWARAFDPTLPIAALVFGEAEDMGAQLGPWGVGRIFHCRLSATDFAPEVAAHTAARLVREQNARWLFCLASATADLCPPTLAAELAAGLVTGCIGLKQDRAGTVTAWQPVHQGRLHQPVALDPERIQVLAWLPEALGSGPSPAGPAAPITAIQPAAGPLAGRVRPIRRVQGDFRTLPLDQAERIVALGRGIMANGLDRITRVADRLAASVGATRPVIDAGLLPFERQIGQTGVQVAPRLLLTCGISGANEFTVGITQSQTVVAINTDPRAPIFAQADLGIVGDAAEILDVFVTLDTTPTQDAHEEEPT